MQAIKRVHQALPIFLTCVPEKMGTNEKCVYKKKTDIPTRYNGISMG